MSIKKYIKIWWIMTGLASQIAFQSRFGAVIFTIGKLLRFIFFLAFLLLIATKVKTVAGYSLWQMIFFYATFNLIDLIPQFFLREVYRFRSYVQSGYFDYILTKPFSPLFRSLFGGSDVLDLSMLVLSGIFLIVSAGRLGEVTLLHAGIYAALLLNALIIALAFHVIVLSIGILTTEVENTIQIYRDLTQMGRVPVDIYKEPIRGLLTFAVPVGVMMTFPAKAFIGLLSPTLSLFALLFGAFFFYASFIFWKFALRRYSSVSS